MDDRIQFLKAMSEVVKECDHRAFYRVESGPEVAIRYCSNCGKSWRMPTKGDYRPHVGQYPDALWEEIDEPEKWESPVLPNYDG